LDVNREQEMNVFESILNHIDSGRMYAQRTYFFMRELYFEEFL
jgi:hypothetical protein